MAGEFLAPLVRVEGSTLAPNLNALTEGIRSGTQMANQSRDLKRQEALAGVQQQKVDQEAQAAKQKQEGQAQLNALGQQYIQASQDPSPQGQQLAAQTFAQLAARDPDMAQKIAGAQKINDEQHRSQLGTGIAQTINAPDEQQSEMIMGLPIDDANKKALLAMDPQRRKQALTLFHQSLEHDISKQLPQQETELTKNLRSAGIDPNSDEGRSIIKQSLTKPLVNNVTETEESKQRAVVQGKKYGELQKRADAAQTTHENIQIMKSLDPKIGATEPLKLKFAAIADGLGLKDTASSIVNVGKAQSVNAIQNKLTLDAMAQQSGPQTNEDRDFIKTTVGGLGDSNAGFAFKNNYLDSLMLRTTEERDFVDQQIESGSAKNLADAGKQWRKRVKDTPLVSAKLKTPDGIPVFYYQFSDKLREQNPDISQADIDAKWRAVNGVKQAK